MTKKAEFSKGSNSKKESGQLFILARVKFWEIYKQGLKFWEIYWQGPNSGKQCSGLGGLNEGRVFQGSIIFSGRAGGQILGNIRTGGQILGNIFTGSQILGNGVVVCVGEMKE